jgi:hypothetical protein
MAAMAKRTLLPSILILALAARGFSQASASPGARETPRAQNADALGEPEKALGLRLSEAWASFGPPERVFALRGQETWQDDVVFQYPDGLSLFWFQDRIWQLRFSGSYSGNVYGLLLGDQADRLASLLGQPLASIGDSYVFELPYQGYPVRLRAVVRGGKVADLYLYRADF